jgi:peptide chain release factor 2
MRIERDNLLRQTSEPTFWDDAEAARGTLARFYFLERLLKRLQQLGDQAAYLEELAGLVRGQRDAVFRRELVESYTDLERNVTFLEVELLSTQAVDTQNALLLLSPVQTQASDEESVAWTNSLAAMYLRWANHKGYDIEAVAALVPSAEDQHSREAPRGSAWRWQLLQATAFETLLAEVLRLPKLRELALFFSGANVYGFLKGEAGYHRRTAKRASGERTQVTTSLAVESWEGSPDPCLEQRLEQYARESGEHDVRRLTSEGARPEVARSYHMEGPRYVRDPRTGVRHHDPNAVLEGDLDDFILAALRQ